MSLRVCSPSSAIARSRHGRAGGALSARRSGSPVAPTCASSSRHFAPLSSTTLYEGLYCARGERENRIKECQLDLFADRTSATAMRANQLRLWLASMAYVLLAALRRIALAGTRLAKATCGSIRIKLLKIGAQVRRSARRIRIAMACPYADIFAQAHHRLCN